MIKEAVFSGIGFGWVLAERVWFEQTKARGAVAVFANLNAIENLHWIGVGHYAGAPA
ncbi:hypothetical protein CCP2SC5_2640002 [Azospirillaceae bacterium]